MADKTNKRSGSVVLKEVDSVTVNLFFDGTKNNLYNTNTYKGLSEKKQAERDEDETSYANAYSNIAWMFFYSSKKSTQHWIYIEGIGTRKGDTNDEPAGYATGLGVTGVYQRAKQAFNEIENKIELKPSMLYINVFGFSRGAATARHFIHLAKSNSNLFPTWKIKSSQIRFKFVGLFDTVSSVGADFSNDVGELKLDFRDLDALDKKITKVLHIIAADEYRSNFSVTNIYSARKSGFGYEVTMNGAHSDIGGSYKKLTSESYYTTNNVEKNWILEKGFFKSNKDELKSQSLGRGQYRHAFTRKDIRNDIHKVSLETMSKMSSRHGSLVFSTGGNGMDGYYKSITDYVNSMMGSIPNSVLNNDPWRNGGQVGRKTVLNKKLSENDSTKLLRHNYVHWSVKNKMALRVRSISGVPSREEFNG